MASRLESRPPTAQIPALQNAAESRRHADRSPRATAIPESAPSPARRHSLLRTAPSPPPSTAVAAAAPFAIHENDYFPSFNAAWAAASLAIGTRNGEQLT